MAENPHAFAELQALLAARADLYRQCDVAIDTGGIAVDKVVDRLAAMS
jgi:hypothetical protein